MAGRRKCNQQANFHPTNPSKTKHIQTKPNKFACFCLDLFGGIGTFQRVTREKNIKKFPFPQLARRVVGKMTEPQFESSSSWGSSLPRPLNPANRKSIAKDSDFRKKLSSSIFTSPAPPLGGKPESPFMVAAALGGERAYNRRLGKDRSWRPTGHSICAREIGFTAQKPSPGSYDGGPQTTKAADRKRERLLGLCCCDAWPCFSQ